MRGGCELRWIVAIKSFFFVVLMMAGLSVNVAWAEGIEGVKGLAAREAGASAGQDSSVGIQAVRAVRVGLAVGSQKMAWDGHGLYGCEGGCSKDHRKYCQCNTCHCYPVCTCRCNQWSANLLCNVGCSNPHCRCNPCRCFPDCKCTKESDSECASQEGYARGSEPQRGSGRCCYCFKH